PSLPSLPHIQFEFHEPGVLLIALNRPERYNAFSPALYASWRDSLIFAQDCPQVRVVVVTGRGSYYSSGADINLDDQAQQTANANQRDSAVADITRILIDFPKLIIACVNGPAYGFAVTTSALCDVVYASENARFQTPFMRWGFCVEGVSSVTFPRILGNSRANEMLLMGRAFSAAEMERFGFVSQVFKSDELLPKVLDIAKEAAKLPRQAVLDSKKVIRDVIRDDLKKWSEAEFDLLTVRLQSDESLGAIREFVEERKRRK
ncbi:ClpP/crotonase, partial [Ramicandelaber brevisporus]